MLDVLIVGAGPAGAVAAMLLARAGARVRLVDRADFPRDKLCGDTVNPGTLARLRRLGIGAAVDARGLRVDGMLVTGERGTAIEGRYPRGLFGRAILRRDLDWLLLQQAVQAGSQFDPHVAVRDAIVDASQHGPVVVGARAGHSGSTRELRARVTIAADGRRSTIAFGLGLARHPNVPRRWAIGAYFDGVRHVSDTCLTPETINAETAERAEPKHSLRVPRVLRCTSVLGEMHVRRGRYIGVAPVPGGATNVCLVKPSHPADGDLRDPAALLTRELARDPLLRDRFADARLIAPPVVLGPLAVDVQPAAIDGLLLAGDAAGFIDPMTGDGLRFAIHGGELAASAALDALARGWPGVHARLAESRRREFGGKWRFNRTLRALVASPRGIEAAALGARLAPFVLRGVISRAGDCDTVLAPLQCVTEIPLHHGGQGDAEEKSRREQV
jgi:flavin-dependent dehydrogenase